MNVKVFGLTDKGKIRENNQDSYLINEEEQLFIVSDGLGGRASGEIASKLAVKSFEAFMIRSKKEKIKWPVKPRKGLTPLQNRMVAAALYSNHKILKKGRKIPALKGMGAAVLGVAVKDNKLCALNAGDCRLYRIRDDKIIQLTEDLTLVGEEERKGNISSEEAKNHPKKHILSSALGHLESNRKIGLLQTGIKENDIFLLCTDGLYRLIDEHGILNIITGLINKSLYQMGMTLVLKANLAGGTDNITIVLLSFGEDTSRIEKGNTDAELEHKQQ